MVKNELFEIVLHTKAKAKNGTSQIVVETSIKGLLYRSEVYMDDHLIDAVEMNCSDIASMDRSDDIFKARYGVAHQKFEDLYTQERIFVKMLTTDGDYIEGEGSLTVITSISEHIFKTEAFLDSTSIDIKKEDLEGEEEKAFKAKYTQSHKEFCKNYIKVPKFPANTFLNPVIKKFPFYKSSPMKAFIFFLVTVVFVLWLISLLVCGKAMKKIVAKVAGKEAGMIVKDLQKGMCSKGGDGEIQTIVGADGRIITMELDADGNPIVRTKDGKKLPDFVVLPESVSFKHENQIYPVYIKNNLSSDALIVLKNRVIFDFSDPLVSADMVVNVLTKEALHIRSGEVGLFEFKIENDFLQSDDLEERIYHGSIVLDAINLTTRESEILTIVFDFNVVKQSEEAK
jgi:hypothetical protein